jgi:uncharacterized membrane protein
VNTELAKFQKVREEQDQALAALQEQLNEAQRSVRVRGGGLSETMRLRVSACQTRSNHGCNIV